MTAEIHHFNAPKKYSDVKILAQDLIADYPDVTDGIIVLFDKDGGMLQFHICTKAQLAWAAADLLVTSTKD